MSDLMPWLIGGTGAVTGIISLIWHILNSRSKVVIDRISFVRENYNRAEKEIICISVNIRNIGNRSTSIEEVSIEIGNRVSSSIDFTPHHISPNSSKKLSFHFNFTPKEFKEILKKKKVKLGVTIIHTFGVLRKHGWTDFSTDYLNI